MPKDRCSRSTWRSSSRSSETKGRKRNETKGRKRNENSSTRHLIFDIGTGSAERLSALKIPYDYLNKVFIGHLHSDHFGDMDALWVGGVVGNRLNPMRVWGPAGHKPEYGTAYALEHMEKMLTWDKGSRLGNVDILRRCAVWHGQSNPHAQQHRDQVGTHECHDQ